MEKEVRKLGDRLAIERTLFAADRSLLAWVRTAVSLISFGFTMFKFLQYIGGLEQVPALMHSHSPRNIGLFLLLIGTISLFMAMLEYSATVKRLTGEGGSKIMLRPSFLAAAATFLLGLTLTVAIALRIQLI